MTVQVSQHSSSYSPTINVLLPPLKAKQLLRTFFPGIPIHDKLETDSKYNNLRHRWQWVRTITSRGRIESPFVAVIRILHGVITFRCVINEWFDSFCSTDEATRSRQTTKLYLSSSARLLSQRKRKREVQEKNTSNIFNRKMSLWNNPTNGPEQCDESWRITCKRVCTFQRHQCHRRVGSI